MLLPPKRYLRLSEARKLFEIAGLEACDRTLERWCEQGKLPAKRWGGRWVIDMQALKLRKETEELYEDVMLVVAGGGEY